MPASLCHTYTDPAEKAAWEEVCRAESKIERLLLPAPRTTLAYVRGLGLTYFIHEDKLYSVNELVFNRDYVNLDDAMNRMDYEGLGVEDMLQMSRLLNQWLLNPVFSAGSPVMASIREQIASLTEDDIEELIEEAADEAAEAAFHTGVRIIQTRIGQSAGDIAGIVFSGDNLKSILAEKFRRYFEAEREHAQ